jgi:thiamine biosynthesis lipoprotein
MAGPPQPHTYPFHAMGSPCELRLYSESRADADALAGAVRSEIGRIERKYSRYLDDSLTTRINRSAGFREGVVVDDETAALLDYADVSFRQSGGLFDVTSGVLRRAWNFKTGRIPAQAQIDALLPAIGWRKVRWERPRIILPVAGMEIDLGGYVKEYTADRVAALCRERGALHGLVDLGGDLSLIGPHPDGEPWKVGVRHPRRPESALASIALASGGIASSGDYERFMIIDGVRYSHLLDPRTGWPVQGLAAVSVVASHCLIAGTASTIAMLKGAAGTAWLDELGLPNLRMDREGRISGTLAFRSTGAEGQDN